MTFIEDGNESFLDDKKTVINWGKMSMIGRMFDQVQRFQQHPYELEKVTSLGALFFRCISRPLTQKPVMTTWLRKGRKVITSDDELYNLSFVCQPKATGK